MTRPIRGAVGLAVVTGCLSVFACTHRGTDSPISTNSHRSSAGGQDDRVADGIAQLRAATDPFHDLNVAIAAGYAPTVADCIIHEGHGAMGYHHVNRGYVDDKLDIGRPEILLYERLADSTYRLNGVEFVLPYRMWPRDSAPPVLMGQKLAREDNLKYWYLHVWAWKANPDGLFSPFNPDVACRGTTGKVYTPSPPN